MLDSATGGGGAGDVTTTTDSNATVASKILTKTGINLGIGEALLNDPTYGPELKKIFDLFKAGNETAALDELFKSKFGKLSSTARTRLVTNLENSDVYKESLNAWKIGFKQKLKSQGIAATEEQLNNYYLKGTPEVTIVEELRTGTKFEPGVTGGSAQESYNELVKIASRNGVSIDMLPKVLGYETLDSVIDDIARGESIDVLSQRIRNYAKTAMPDYVKKLIDEGNDLTDIIAPYRATISNELEIPYNSVDVTDRYVQNALSKNMSLSDLRKELRRDDRWQYTTQAHKEVSDVALKVLQDFGFQG